MCCAVEEQEDEGDNILIKIQSSERNGLSVEEEFSKTTAVIEE